MSSPSPSSAGHICTQCEQSFQSNYCPDCGRPAKLRRIDGAYLLQELANIFNFDKGILFTIRELLWRPGKSIRTFILEDRNRLVKPIIFLIVCSLVYTLAQQALRFEDGYLAHGGLEESTVGTILAWIQQNYGYANIIMALFIAAWIKLFFRATGYNYFEFLIALCFLMGISMLFFAMLGILESWTPLSLLQVGSIVIIAYIVWGISRFLEKGKIGAYLKLFAAYLLGMFSFYFLAILLGTLIDLWLK